MLTYKIWTTEELNLLKKVVDGKKSFEALHKEFFPDRTASSLQSKARQLKLENPYYHTDYTQNDSFWSVPNPINCYWAGVMAADASISCDQRYGTKSFHWAIAKADLNLMESFKEDIQSDGKITHYSKIKEGSGTICHGVHLGIFSQQWIKDLEKNFNIVHLKTKRLAPPNLSEELLWYYLKGYIDGDGAISIQKRPTVKYANGEFVADLLVFSFVSASQTIIEWIKVMSDKTFTGFRKTNRVVRSLDGGKYFQYSITGQKAVQLFLKLSKLETYCLERKWKNPEVLALVEKELEKNPLAYKDFI